MDPRAANSWPLRSPGILSRRAPRGFLPLGQQLLDQPSTAMRNPSHQLNDQSWSKGHARPSGQHRRWFCYSTWRSFNPDDLSKPRDWAQKTPFWLKQYRSEKCEVYFAMAPVRDRFARGLFAAAVFEARVAQIVIVRPPGRSVVQPGAALASSWSELAATIRCIMAMNRF